MHKNDEKRRMRQNAWNRISVFNESFQQVFEKNEKKRIIGVLEGDFFPIFNSSNC